MRQAKEEAGLEICRQLGIDPSRVLSIDIFVLQRTLIVKTLDEDIRCRLVGETGTSGELIFRIVPD